MFLVHLLLGLIVTEIQLRKISSEALTDGINFQNQYRENYNEYT